MTSVPKLLASIRENKTKVEKAAKARRAAAPADGAILFAGSVETPDWPQAPNNYIAQALDECTSVEHCEELLEHALAHRYSEDGQTVQAIRARIAELKSGKSRKRGGTR